MVFAPKNPNVATPSTIQPTGAIGYWRSNPTPNAPFIDMGFVVVTNRAKNQTTFDVLGNRNGTEQLLKRIIKSSAETITFYSKNNTDEDVQALHSGSAVIKGTGMFAGVDGYTDTAAPATGEFVLVGQSPDPTALVQVAWFPFAQLTGSGEATEDILRYPQFDVTNLVWGSSFQANLGANLLPYVTSTSAVKIGLLVPAANLDAVLSAIQATGGSTPDANPAFIVSHAYNLNDVVHPITPNGYDYKVTTAGTSASTEPVWPTAPGSTVVSGTATFTRQ
jgi:hypothetical protein